MYDRPSPFYAQEARLDAREQARQYAAWEARRFRLVSLAAAVLVLLFRLYPRKVSPCPQDSLPAARTTPR